MSHRVLKSIAAAVFGALTLGVLAIVAEVAVAWFRMWLAMRAETGDFGGGGFSFVIPGVGLFAAPVGFAIGFFWQFRGGGGAPPKKRRTHET